MLEIDKNSVDFLVTAGMVQEVTEILGRDLPKIKILVTDLLRRRPLERVYFVACGSPLNAAATAKLLFDRFSTRIPCGTFSGWNFVDAPPAKLDASCLVIGISHYGKTPEVIEALALAQTHGAATVAVTNLADNPIAAQADWTLDYHAESIWTAHLLIAYAFAIEIIRRDEPNPELDMIYAQLAELPPVLARLVQTCEADGRKLGERASKWPWIYMVAGGILSPLAYKEGIVTQMEFAWTHGSVMDSAEFRHGPLEIVEAGVPFIFLLGTDANRHTTQRALDFVHRYTDAVIVFDFAELETGLHPLLAPFALFVPLEWFYYYLALYKDHNPDDRRYYGGLVAY